MYVGIVPVKGTADWAGATPESIKTCPSTYADMQINLQRACWTFTCLEQQKMSTEWLWSRVACASRAHGVESFVFQLEEQSIFSTTR